MPKMEKSKANVLSRKMPLLLWPALLDTQLNEQMSSGGFRTLIIFGQALWAFKATQQPGVFQVTHAMTE